MLVKLNHSIKAGFSFGLTSGIITTLGLLVGLEAGTGSKSIIIGGILTIAIADAFSDSLGIHISEESEGVHTHGEVWQSTAATFLAKFIVAISFVAPVFFLPLNTAVLFSIAWGLILQTIGGYMLSQEEKLNPWKGILEHLAIMVAVIIITHLVGDWIHVIFYS